MSIEAFRVFTNKQPPQPSKAEAATDALVAEMRRVIDDLRQDRDEWRAIAQSLSKLGALGRPEPQLALPAPTETKQTEPEQPPPGHWRQAWNRLYSRRRARVTEGEAECANGELRPDQVESAPTTAAAEVEPASKTAAAD